MSRTFFEHPVDEDLERYLLHNGTEDERELIETHILACESCVSKLEELEIQIAATKLAFRELHQEKVAKAVARERAWWRNWFTVPRLSTVSAVAALVLGVLLLPRLTNQRVTDPSAVQVSLGAYRGSDTKLVPKNHKLDLHLNTGQLPQGAVRIELVDQNGSQVWRNVTVIRENGIDTQTPAIRKAGNYFVRLYSNPHGKLLREFAFQVND